MELINPQNLFLSKEQIQMALPYFILVLGGMLSLCVGVIRGLGGAKGAMLVSLATVGLSIFAVIQNWGEPGIIIFNNMLAIDGFTEFFNLLLLSVTFLAIFSSYPYLEKEGIHYSEYYSLLVFSCLGMMLLASSLDLVVLFVALELMSIAVYVLVGFRRTDLKSNEAAIKYFILGSAASACLLFGIALIYGATGSMNIHLISEAVKGSTAVNSLFWLGAILVIAGFLFKIATVPFHMWMPDVYEGAPTTVTNFMTTGLKAAAFASFLRIFIGLGYTSDITSISGAVFHNILWVVALLTMFLGNVIALAQKNIKRMLAYSSIAHSGYILVGFIAAGRSEYGLASVVLYLASYVVMNFGAFSIVALLSSKGDKNIEINDFSGLGFRYPALGFAMAVFMFSMAGIPPTAGFAGKYLIFSSAIQAGEVPLAILAVLCSAISAYYYLRVIVVMYMKDPIDSRIVHFAIPSVLAVIITVFGTLQFGLFPSALIEAAKKAVMYL